MIRKSRETITFGKKMVVTVLNIKESLARLEINATKISLYAE